MGQRNQFEPGDKVPNNGVYIEISEVNYPIPTGISDAQTIELKKGETFPDTKNKNRKWTYKN
ncbi:MAG: YjzC family protein [Bacilli bacterium]